MDELCRLPESLRKIALDRVLATTYQPRDTNPTREDALRMPEEIRAHATGAGFINPRSRNYRLRLLLAICVLAHQPQSRLIRVTLVGRSRVRHVL